MGVLLNSIKPCFNWKASLHFPIIWSKLKADAHSLIKSLISVPGNQNSLSLLCRDSFANCTQFQRFSKENLSMQSVNCHSVNNCLNIQTTQQLPIKKINYRLLASKQTEALLGWAGLCSRGGTFKQWVDWVETPHPTAAGSRGQRTAVCTSLSAGLSVEKGRRCSKLCFQRSALLSKKLASKVLIGTPKINPFNE